MNVALIIAGGVGRRMGQDVPKQFINVYDKPVIIYTLYANTMMVELGERLYFSKGSEKNIKLTTKDDLELFKAYLKQEEDKWLK